VVDTFKGEFIVIHVVRKENSYVLSFTLKVFPSSVLNKLCANVVSCFIAFRDQKTFECPYKYTIWSM